KREVCEPARGEKECVYKAVPTFGVAAPAADDVTEVVDAKRSSAHGARRIDRREGSLLQQEPVEGAARVAVAADDLRAGVDAPGSRARCVRELDVLETARIQNETAKDLVASFVEANDPPAFVDSLWEGVRRAGHVDRGELAMPE